jgi:hypothetical protein
VERSNSGKVEQCKSKDKETMGQGDNETGRIVERRNCGKVELCKSKDKETMGQ